MSNGSVNFATLTEGTLNPDSRVNYNFGLVLGVNEFRQEQMYFLDKHYLHNNELHGYGTVSGLSVDRARYPEDKPTDIQVAVHPGMAIDQLGRPLIVREDQCARLGAWLAQQVKDDQQNNIDTFEKHRPDEDGYLTAYVVAKYNEVAEQSVPVAGGLTGNGNSTSTPSRLRDSFTIEFRWDRPQMPAWDAVRKFAAVLDRVHVEESAMGEKKGEQDEDEDEDERIEQIIEDICKRVRGIGEAAPSSKKAGGDHKRRHHEHELFEDEEADRSWYLPAKDFQYALDRVFTVWVTEVRQKLPPNLVDTQAAPSDQEVGILLARIDFQPDDPFNPDKPVILRAEKPEGAGRPFLLSTQVLQELVAAGGSSSHPPREFATLQTCTNRTVQAWIHHPAPIRLRRDHDDWNEALELKCDGRQMKIAGVKRIKLPELKNVIELSINADENDPTSMISPGARVELTFKLHNIRIQDEDEDRGAEGKKPEDTGLVGGVEDIGQGLQKGERDVEKDKVIKGVEHAVGGILHGAEDVVEGIAKGVEDIGEGVVKGAEDIGEDLEQAGKAALKGHFIKGAEDVVKGAAQGVEDVVEGAAKGVDAALGVPEEEEDERHSLRGSIDDFDIEYVGYDRMSNTITVYTIADHQPARELATLYLFNPQTASVRPEHPAAGLAEATGSESTLHLWFHTDSPVQLSETCQVLVPLSFTQPPQAMTFTAAAPPGNTYSYFWALVPPADFPLRPGELLMVQLDTNQIRVEGPANGGEDGEDHSQTLTSLLTGLPYRFAGYDGDHTIVAYHQVPSITPTIIEAGEREERRETERREPEREERREREDREGLERRPALPFVTITHLPTQAEEQREVTNETFELWFHLVADPAGERASFNEGISCEVWAELSDLRRSGKVDITGITPLQLNVYAVSVALPQPAANQQAYYLRFRFPLSTIPVSIRGGQVFESLGAYMESRGIHFEGFNGQDAIVAYVRIPARATA